MKAWMAVFLAALLVYIITHPRVMGWRYKRAVRLEERDRRKRDEKRKRGGKYSRPGGGW